MEGSETGGAWVGTGLGREDGRERNGRRTGLGEGRWRGPLEGSETGGAWAGEGRWRGARRGAGREDGAWSFFQRWPPAMASSLINDLVAMASDLVAVASS